MASSQTFAYTPTASNLHRILLIPELLDIIFSFLDQQSNATNACVCKAWSNIALPALWKDVHDLWRLVGLLVPLKKRRDSIYELSRTPQSTDWIRFSRYSPFVRRLHYNIHCSTHRNLHHSVFHEIARTRLQLNVLPNLNTLHWISASMHDLGMSVVFMHERVKNFVVWLPFDSDPRYEEGLVMDVPFLQDVVSRMPHLTHIDLRMDFSSHLIAPHITTFLSSLPALQTVVLPDYHITSQVLTALSRLPNLGTIQFEYGPDQGIGLIDDVQHVSPTLSEGAFPSLWDLSLTISMSDMRRFLEMPFAPINLTSLFIDCPSMQSAEEVHLFLRYVAERCRLLKALYLELLWMDSPNIFPEREDRITFEVLEPLLACHNLVEFTLSHDHPVDISQSNIETLASKWPSLETFILACEPVKLSSPSTLTLLSLLPFARHCPELHTLGLYVNASTADIPAAPVLPFSSGSGSATNRDIRRFSKLTKLSMGVSNIQDEGSVALFLSHLCPIGCEIECGVTWHTDLEEMLQDNESTVAAEEVIKEVMKRCGKWTEVGKMLPLLTRLRVEERARCSALGDEVEDLRIRNRILMERGKANMDGDGTCVVG